MGSFYREIVHIAEVFWLFNLNSSYNAAIAAGMGNKVRKKGQKRIHQPRFAFMTKTEVDHLEDGYRWRKYGRKAVKNSPFPRSYYRCTNSRCTVKKRVERSFEDPTVIITTYEGQHCHHTVLGFHRGGLISHHHHQNFTTNTAPGQLAADPDLVSQFYYPKVLDHDHQLPLKNPSSMTHYSTQDDEDDDHQIPDDDDHHEVGKIISSHALPEQIIPELLHEVIPTGEGLLGDMVSPNMRNRS